MDETERQKLSDEVLANINISIDNTKLANEIINLTALEIAIESLESAKFYLEELCGANNHERN